MLLDGEEVPVNDVLNLLEQLDNAGLDEFGSHSLKDYEIYNVHVADILVRMGIVKSYKGSRMANLYCVNDENKFEKLKNIIYKQYEN